MNKELLIALIDKDLQELQILTEGFSEMENFPKTLIDLSVDKAKNIVDCLQKLPLNNKNSVEVPQNELEIEQQPFVEEKPLETVVPAEERTDLKQQNFDEVFEVLQEPNTAPEIEEDFEIVVLETPQNEPIVEQKEELIIEEIIEPKIEPIIEEKVEEIIEPKVEPIIEEKVEEIIEPKVEPIIEAKEEPKTEMIFGQPTKIPVVQGGGQSKVPDLKNAFSIADRFKFQRELFDGNGEKFSKSLTLFNEMDTLEQAQDYITNNLKFDLQNPVVQAFVEILKRKF